MTDWIVSYSVLILIVITLRKICMGKISLRLQYAIWALVLLRLLIPFQFGSSNFSVVNLTVSNNPDPVPSISATTDLTTPTRIPSENLEHVFVEQGNPIHTPQEEPQNLRTMLPEFREITWICGILMTVGMFLFTNLRFRRKILASRRSFGMEKKGLRVYLTDQIDTPCLFGIMKPAIYLTPEVAENETLLRHALEHEYHHYCHGDHLWAILRCACLSLHWYNPLVWWAAFLSQRDGELACDEATLKALGEGERAEYGRTLIGMTCRKPPHVLSTATTMTTGKSGFKERIVLIAKKPRMAVYTLIGLLLVASVAVLCTFTGAKNQKQVDAQLEKALIAQSNLLTGAAASPEEIHYIATQEDYSVVYSGGQGPALFLYRHKVQDDQVILEHYANGEYAISGGLSLNHLEDNGKHIYFGTINETHWIPDEDVNIPLGWTDLVFLDASGKETVITVGEYGYLCVLDAPMTDFRVVVNGGKAALTMQEYLDQGYPFTEVSWYENQVTEPTETTPPTTVPAPTAPAVPNVDEPINPGEVGVLQSQPDPDKVCLMVLPTGSPSGEHFQYIIPENQEQAVELLELAEPYLTTDIWWEFDATETGWRITYQGRRWQFLWDGTLDHPDSGLIHPNAAKPLFDYCKMALEKAGMKQAVRREEIHSLKSATLHWNGTHTVTDAYSLSLIETWFSGARNLGSAMCPMDAILELEREDGEILTLSIATDSCAAWMSEGCVYGYGVLTEEGYDGNESFFALFAPKVLHEMAQQGPEVFQNYWFYMNWRQYNLEYGWEGTQAMMDKLLQWGKADPENYDYMILSMTEGLDGAFAEYYSYILTQLFEADPEIFRRVCLNDLPDKQEETVLNMMAYSWNVDQHEARSRVDEGKTE